MKTKIIILLTIYFQLCAFNLLAQVPSPAPQQKGAVLLQKEVSIGKEYNVGILHDILLKLGAPLIIKTSENIWTYCLCTPRKLN